MRAANSAAAVAGEHEVGVAVDEAGDDAAPGDVDPLVGGRGPARCRASTTCAPSIDHASASASSPRSVLVTSRPMPLDDGGHASTRRSSAATSIAVWQPSRTTTRPPTTTWCTSAAVRREHDAGDGVVAVRCRPCGPSRGAPRSGRRGRRPRCGRRRASRCWRGRRSLPSAAAPPARGRPRCSDARRSSSSTAAGLLQQVDHGVGVAAERQAGTGVAQGDRRPDAVGEVALGRRADAAGAAGCAEQGDVVGGEVGGVDGGEALVQRAGRGEDPDRRGAVGRQHLLVLGRLLGHVGVQRRARARGPRRDGRDVVGRDGTRRVDGGADGARAGRAAARRPGRPTRSTVPSENRRCTGSSSTPGPPRR